MNSTFYIPQMVHKYRPIYIRIVINMTRNTYNKKATLYAYKCVFILLN